MVERNFPRLCLSFSRYKDTPYQTVVVINHKSDSECEGFLTDPTIEYYYIAAEGEEIPLPIIIESADLSPFQNHEKTIVEIQNSYLRQGKVAHDYAVTQTGFSSTLTSRRSGAEVPLSDYVYESIKTSLKEVLGS